MRALRIVMRGGVEVIASMHVDDMADLIKIFKKATWEYMVRFWRKKVVI